MTVYKIYNGVEMSAPKETIFPLEAIALINDLLIDYGFEPFNDDETREATAELVEDGYYRLSAFWVESEG